MGLGVGERLCVATMHRGGPTPALLGNTWVGSLRQGTTDAGTRPLATHLVTTAILTPKTPVCFLEGIRFKLNSLLVNLTESFTSICGGNKRHGFPILLVLTAQVPRDLGSPQILPAPGQAG